MNNNYSYLRPPSNLKSLFNKRISRNLNNDRLIFENQNTWDSDEIQGVNKIYQYLKKRKPDKKYSKSLLLKMYHLGNFDIHDSVTKLSLYEQWHQKTNLITEKTVNILEAGVFYQYGKDSDYHPIIYFRPCRIILNKQPHYFNEEDYQLALKNFLDPIEEYMMVPGVVQTWILVIDLQKQKVNIPIDLALRNIEKIVIAYPYRLKKILFVNVVKIALPFISNLAESIPKQIIDLTPPKISIINTFTQLSVYIPIQQRQKKYGGILKNLQIYWPISVTNKPFEQSEHVEHIIDRQQNTQFQSIMNEADFDIDQNLQMRVGVCSSCNII